VREVRACACAVDRRVIAVAIRRVHDHDVGALGRPRVADDGEAAAADVAGEDEALRRSSCVASTMLTAPRMCVASVTCARALGQTSSHF
jgi:hypothetical protein